MTITINKDSFPRFAKRLKKSLQNKSINLSHSEVQDIAAQSLGKENFYEIQRFFIQPKDILETNEKPTTESINIDYEEVVYKKYSEAAKDDNKRITLTLAEAQDLVNCYGGDEETEITISRFKNSDNRLYAWFTEYPEEGCMFLGKEKTLFEEMILLNRTVQLPHYQNMILCILSSLIYQDRTHANFLIKRLTQTDTKPTFGFLEKESSYHFYMEKANYVCTEKIQTIIASHKHNLTVFISLIEELKKTNNFIVEDFKFLKDTVPTIWELFKSLEKNNKSEEISKVMNIYLKEKTYITLFI